MTFEYLESGAEPSRRWPWVGGAVLVLLAALVAGGLWWTGHLREQANDALGSAVVEASRDARAGQDVVLSMLQYTSPVIWSSSVSEDVRAGLRQLVQRSAAQVVVTLDSAQATAESAFVLPWDTTQVRAKDAVLAYVLAHRERFQRIADDARALDDVFGAEAPSPDSARALLRASGASLDADR